MDIPYQCQIDALNIKKIGKFAYLAANAEKVNPNMVNTNITHQNIAKIAEMKK
jgi:hypothetical protein